MLVNNNENIRIKRSVGTHRKNIQTHRHRHPASRRIPKYQIFWLSRIFFFSILGGEGSDIISKENTEDREDTENIEDNSHEQDYNL